MADTTQVPALLREAAALLRAERDHHFEQAGRCAAAMLDLEAALRKLDPVDPALEAMIATPDGPAPAGVAVYVEQPEQHGPAAAVWDDQARAVIERIEALAQPDDPGTGTSHEILQAVLLTASSPVRPMPGGAVIERWVCEQLGETVEQARAAVLARDPEECEAADAAAGVLLHGIEGRSGAAIASVVSIIDCPAVVAWMLAQEQARANLRPTPKAVRKGVTEACESRLAALREASR
jgi:hypothetical protein